MYSSRARARHCSLLLLLVAVLLLQLYVQAAQTVLPPPAAAGITRSGASGNHNGPTTKPQVPWP